MNQKVAVKLDQSLLQGYDVQMIQNVLALPGVFFSDFVQEYCKDNGGLKVRSKVFLIDEVDYDQLKQQESLYEHLAFQIETCFAQGEKEEALTIAASLDHNGFYSGKVTPVLEKIWQLDPVGIAAASPQQALILQLQEQEGVHQLATDILKEGYKAFLVRDIKKLSQMNHVSTQEIIRAIEEIKRLDPFPGRRFDCEVVKHIVPEMILSFDGKWHLEFVKEFYPSVQLRRAGSAKKQMDAKRFIYQLHQRKNRLEWIVSKIVKAQEAFLLGKGEKKVLSRAQVIQDLDISESTLSRILSEKYIQTPAGLFSLGYFFSRPTLTPSCDQTVEKAKQLLQKIIDQENKQEPYPDEILKKLLQASGVICSRRTVAKYRKKLHISGAYHRTLR